MGESYSAEEYTPAIKRRKAVGVEVTLDLCENCQQRTLLSDGTCLQCGVAGPVKDESGNKPSVVVPFANAGSPALRSVQLCLTSQGARARFYEVQGLYGYAELFIEYWKTEKPFIIVEHDILPWAGALEQLEVCPEPWCGFKYDLGCVPAYQKYPCYLGCCKFEPLRLGVCPVESNFQWNALDGHVARALHRERDIRMHFHQPDVVHLHRYGVTNAV